jgi:hypothetical protein
MQLKMEALEVDPAKPEGRYLRRAPSEVKPHRVKIAAPLRNALDEASDFGAGERVRRDPLAPAHPNPATAGAKHRVSLQQTFIHRICERFVQQAHDVSDRLAAEPSSRRDLPELSEEESPESYFSKFRGILSAMPRWRIRRRISLGLVYFGKLLMFRYLYPS